MKLSELKTYLKNLDTIAFQLPNGKLVPSHFHVTEVGKVAKTFIDCGGKLRQEKNINLQLWEADDYNHRLHPEKLLNIITLSEEKLNLQDLDIEVEYQSETIGKYSLDFSNNNFQLIAKQTNCLALDACGLPPKKENKNLSELQNTNSCAPGSGCC